MELRAVGVVHSAVTRRKEMPAWGAPAEVEVFPAFAAALHHIEKHSHLWILAWFHQGEHEREVLQVTPRGILDRGPEGLHGVFAVRSPARPNPIGLSAARVESRHGLRLQLDRLDFLDGTPVVDIKPYFITRDVIFSANGRAIGQPLSREALRESLALQAVHFHGALTPDLALGVRLVEHYRAEFHALREPESWQAAAPAARPQVADALMGLTRVTLGRGTLHLLSGPEVHLNGARYRLLPAPPADAQQVLAAPDGELFSLLA